MPGPPVARIRLILLWCIRYCDFSTVGASIQPMISFGAPASTAASRRIFAAAIVLFAARGCGEKIIPFLVFRLIRALNIAVEVGLVVGIIPAITPMGSAILRIPADRSSSIIPQVFSSLYLL